MQESQFVNSKALRLLINYSVMYRKTLLPLLAVLALGSACVNLSRRSALGGSMARLSRSFARRFAKANKIPDEDDRAKVDAMFAKGLSIGSTRAEVDGKKLMDPNDFPELMNDLPGWKVTEVVRASSSEYISIFDDPEGVNKMYGDMTDPFSIGSDSLRDISEAYDFSLSYLGDFVVQLGAPTPIDIDAPISTYLSGDQIFTLMQSINSLDPSDVGIEYDSLTARELCDESDITTAKMLRICKGEDLNLPFGLETVLHVSVVERILAVVNDDAYADPIASDSDEDDDDYLEDEQAQLITDEDRAVW